MVYRKRNFARRSRKRTYRRKRTVRRPRRRTRRTSKTTKLAIMRTINARQPYKCNRFITGVAMTPTVASSYIDLNMLNIPKWDSATTGTQANLNETRTRDSVYLKSIRLQLSLVTDYFPQHRLRVIMLWNRTINEQLNFVTLGNLFQSTTFQDQGPITAYNQMVLQRINENLLTSRRDILFDRTYTLNTSASPPANPQAAMGKNSIRFTKWIQINKLVHYEIGASLTNTIAKEGNIFMIFLVSTIGTGTPAGNIYLNWNRELFFLEN